jgi:hypothetical protein
MEYKYLFEKHNFENADFDETIDEYLNRELFLQDVKYVNLKNDAEIEKINLNEIEDINIENNHKINSIYAEDVKSIRVKNDIDCDIDLIYIKDAEEAIIEDYGYIDNLEIRNVNNVYIDVETYDKEDLESKIKEIAKNYPIYDINNIEIKVYTYTLEAVESIPKVLNKYEKELNELADNKVKIEFDTEYIDNDDLTEAEYEKIDDIVSEYSKTLKDKEQGLKQKRNSSLKM